MPHHCFPQVELTFVKLKGVPQAWHPQSSEDHFEHAGNDQ